MNLEEIIAEDQWRDLLIQNQGNQLVDVYLNSEEIYSNPYKNTYVVKIKKELGCRVQILFPNHPDSKKRVLDSKDYKKIVPWSDEINARLEKSKKGEVVQLAIVYENRMFRFHGQIGTGYLAWAERVNQTTINRQQNIIAENVPVYFELNGKMDIRNIVILPRDRSFISSTHGHQKMYPIELDTITSIFPTDTIIFSCEADMRRETTLKIKTITERKADDLTKDPVVRRLVNGIEGEEMVFDDDFEDYHVMSTSSIETDIELKQITPRVDDL